MDAVAQAAINLDLAHNQYLSTKFQAQPQMRKYSGNRNLRKAKDAKKPEDRGVKTCYACQS